MKVNAFLKQRLQFENIARLEKGIIAYEKWFTEQQQELSLKNSVWQGRNFLFDRRRLYEDKPHLSPLEERNNSS